MTKRFGFTLAEVLITLGIIGVVAAMTMPTLLNSTNGAQFKTAYKKALSVLSQAVVLNIALDDYDMSQATDTSTDTSKASLYAIFNNRMNVVEAGTDKEYDATYKDATETTFGGANNYTLFFNDGIAFSFPADAANCTEASPCRGAIDVNGEKNPNKEVTDAASPSDIYPVIMYDQTIMPATEAAKEVLYGN